MLSFYEIIAFSKVFTPTLVLAWGWSTLFAVMSDLVVVDGVFIIIATMMTLTVGAAPDACGKCRNCWLKTVPEAIKDAAE